MMPKSTKRIISLSLITILMVFFIYKSIANRSTFTDTINVLSSLQTLQAQLHRDVLRYRYGQIKQYDRINKLISYVSSTTDTLIKTIDIDKTPGIYKDAIIIRSNILNQNNLIEDFKTMNATTQNSLTYFSREHEIAINNAERQYIATTKAISKLSIYLLEYARNPSSSIAKKVYPILDELHKNSSTDVISLINHSLIIIEQLPQIESLISQIRLLDIENKLSTLKTDIATFDDESTQQSRI